MNAQSATALANEREFAFSDEDFDRIRAMIRARAGIALNGTKRNMVYSRLARLLRARPFDTFSDYLDQVERDPGLAQSFVNALTTNLTSFFRESHHFPVLAEHLRALPRGATIELWCSAASTGEEPYSMAMTAIEVFDSDRPPVRILATDVDTNVLETARRGIYRSESVAQLSPQQLRRHFLRGAGAQDGFVRVRPEVQALVTYRPLNLLAQRWELSRPFAAIFCRNVMIYFDKPTQHAILERFIPLLTGGGLFFAGHSENFTRASHQLRLRGKTVYEKVNASGSP
ncbi:MAG TPA: CheR family methyltransferase [Casimicrobiaceae bacterium]